MMMLMLMLMFTMLRKTLTAHVGWVSCWFSPLVREFSLRVLLFSFLRIKKPTYPNSNSIWNARTRLKEFLRTPKCSVGEQITRNCNLQFFNTSTNDNGNTNNNSCDNDTDNDNGDNSHNNNKNTTTTTTTTTNNNNNSNLGTAHILTKILLAKCTINYEGLWFCSARCLRKTTTIRQQLPHPGWHPAVLVKTRVCVGCSVPRAHKWSRALLFKDFQERQGKITK